MNTHISARLSWHNNGWNGRVCNDPKANTYCVGQYSFPGDMIAKRRDLDIELAHSGEPISTIEEYIPPCIWSCNAFGDKQLVAYNPPPSWFNDGTDTKKWDLPPYTICLWPYEEMYKDEVRNYSKGTKYNATARRDAANEYFEQISPHKSLIFYYTNYSNPFSENDEHQYVIVGVSRINKVGTEITWDNQSQQMEEKYGPNVWARNITSAFPDQGLRLPYELYMDSPDILEKILFVPENGRDFKYATRHLSDDRALGLIERLNEIVGTLQTIGDASENWGVRQEWLASVMAELWSERGLYPGLLTALDYLKFTKGIHYAMDRIPIIGENQVKESLFLYLDGDESAAPEINLTKKEFKALRKRWQYLEDSQQELLQDVIPRLDLTTYQISNILNTPESVSITSSYEDIIEDPYILGVCRI